MEWKEITLKDIAFYRNDKVKFDEISFDCYISTENMIENKGSIVPPSSIPSSGSSNMYLESDILVSNIRPYFKKIWLADKDGACSNDVLVFAIKNKSIDASFLYYRLSADHFFAYVMAGSNGVKMPRGNKKSIMDYKFLLPPLKTQQKIASILSNYDKLIENNTQRIKFLESMAEELYKEWFVRLRFPGYEDVEVVDGLPVGWDRKKLGESVNNFDSKRKPLSKNVREIRKGQYPYYGAASILDYIDDYLFSGKFLLVGEDGTVITKSGTPMLQFINSRFWVSNHAHVLTGKVTSTEYLYLFLNSYQISGSITGAAQPKINQQNLNRIEILIPTNDVLEIFDKTIVPIFEKNFILKEKNKNLKQTRDLLLPRLMSGKLNVQDLDII